MKVVRVSEFVRINSVFIQRSHFHNKFKPLRKRLKLFGIKRKIGKHKHFMASVASSRNSSKHEIKASVVIIKQVEIQR